MFCNSLSLALVLTAVFVCQCHSQFPGTVHDVGKSSENLDWWQTAVFYQIYPRSFMDSNDDGIGDLKGIISKLSHLKDAGITATWLSPIFASPGTDQGYDISDYRAIDPIFGDMSDFEALVAKAKELGIKIILDFVPNHTSDEHEWFQKSENKTEGYEDFYIWKEGKSPPNNWISEFSGPAWTYSEKRKAWYYHKFASKQPDLNYRNPKVVKGMKDVLKFWLDKGIDGFRMDAVPYLFEDPSFANASLARGYTECVNEPGCQDQSLRSDQDETYDMIYQFREFVDQYVKDNDRNDTIVLMSEAYTSIENTMLYYQSSDGSRKGAHFTFNFNLIVYLKDENFTIDDISNAINKWLVYLPRGATSNWVLGNHDNHRVASRFGEENVDAFNMLTAFLPGVMVTYNGEEIGMRDGEVTCEQGMDPGAINDCPNFAKKSRDFERTPFQWDNSTNAGFSNATTWLPVGSSKDTINLKDQNKTGVESHYNVYKRLVEFRTRFRIPYGTDSVSVIKVSDTVLQITRQIDEKEYIFLFNIGNSSERIQYYKRANKQTVVVASVGSNKKKESSLSGLLTMKPHESLILQSSAATAVFSLLLITCMNVLLNVF